MSLFINQFMVIFLKNFLCYKSYISFLLLYLFRLACGIIARSAGLFENSKKICACDGLTLWDEKNAPLSGSKRTQNNTRSSSNL